MSGYSYRVDGPLPLSGSFVVERHKLDGFGKGSFDGALNKRSLTWNKDPANKNAFNFPTLLSAAKALKKVIKKIEGSDKKLPRPIFRK